MDDPYLKLKASAATHVDELCQCPDIETIYLAHILGSNPIYCAICNGEVLPEKLGFSKALAEEILTWNNVYGALFSLWLDSGEYEEWALVQLLKIDGQANTAGFKIVEKLSQHVSCYYLWFSDENSAPAFTKCPRCSQNLTDSSGKYKACHPCRIYI